MEYFAGVGLIHEALRPLGWTCQLANDNDPKKVRAYEANYPNVPVSALDIRDLSASDIPPATLATASFPCIDLSQAGGRVGIHGTHSGVVWAYLDRIREAKKVDRQPRFLFLENVAGLLTLQGGKSIDILLHAIAELGYSIDVVQVDARHFLPQARNRVFIIAGLGLPLSLGEMPTSHIRRYKVREVFDRNRDLPWHFFDFPRLPSATYELKDLLEDIPVSDPRWWNAERMSYFWEHLEHHHRPQLEEMARRRIPVRLTAVRRGRRRGLREQIFNLRFDGLASCLRTPKGGSSIQFVVEVRSDGSVGVRRITGLESARLQGVGLPDAADDFAIPQVESDALWAFGDAVCVPAVRWVFQHSIEAVMSGVAAEGQTQLVFDLAREAS
ncbi:DNA (cytosine-5-)-methyltransferase [Arthrobacter sp. NEB 688]|uniref:DNA cytosine methyltransferase n=1 Tax=Arthrobacter sp. NEB 688 TaxID=904039 RepID=UPI0015661248|nr:DNA (cytosine-5-)-methyltransferase [Arthrobacter sp. NEB 688]QKE82771.1 DNA (cytosine-5-)-methyltransferase [Arthrobacter sp. NEB 688]